MSVQVQDCLEHTVLCSVVSDRLLVFKSGIWILLGNTHCRSECDFFEVFKLFATLNGSSTMLLALLA